MSMFHELMMRKKEETLYLVIKGSLTNNNGIVSGWTASDYVYTNDFVLDVSQDFEICAKITTPSDFGNDFNTLFRNNYGSVGSPGFAVGINQLSKKLQTYIFNSSGTQVVSGVLGQTVVQFGTDYIIRFSRNGNSVKLESSADNGTSWITENSWTIADIRNSGLGVAFGGGNTSLTSQYFRGSIDFNSSHIKLGSTKYNLQAVVGYIVVGSPTITDGVVSGFSSANYLTIANSINAQDITEFVVKFKINSGATANAQIPIFNSTAIKVQSTTTASTSGFYYTQFLIAGFGFVQANSYLAFNSWHWIKYTNDGTTMRAFYSSDGINWTEGQNKSSVGMSTTGNFEIGKSNFETGEIDFNETYIKINNKLWFNGQQA